MSDSVLIIVDQPPLPCDRWVRDLLNQAGYVPASVDAINEAVKADPEANQALRDTFLQADAQQTMAPYYWRAFQKLYGDQRQVGIYGIAWLTLAPKVDACIVDWSGLGMVTSKVAQSLSIQEIEQARRADIELGQAWVREKAAVLPTGRLCELPAGLDDAQRVNDALAFLRAQGLA